MHRQQVRSAKCGVRSATSKVRSAKCEVRRATSKVRRATCEARGGSTRLLLTLAGIVSAGALVPTAARAQSATFVQAREAPGTLQAAALPVGIPEPLDFWQGLGDTTLARLTAEALRANRDARGAEARVAQFRAARLNAALDLAPTVTVAAGYTRQRIAQASFGLPVPNRGLWDGEVRAEWEVDVFGRLRHSLRGQDALAASAGDNQRDVQRLVAAELATAYFALRGVQDQLNVARRNAENQRGTLQLTRDRLDAGRGTGFDTERAQAQLSTTLAGIPTLEAEVAVARYRIGVLVGRDPRSVDLGEGGTLPPLPETLALGDTETRILARPDVMAAERRLAAETAFVGAAKADYLPRISIGGTAGFTSTEFDSLGRSGSGRYAVGPVVTWPLLNLGRVRARVDAARALEAEATARYEQTLLLAREEMESAQVAYHKARERLDRLTEAAEASARAAQLARIRYEGGVADFLQVLDAERSLLSAQNQLAEGRTDAVTALVAVYRALGAGPPGR